MNDLAEFAAKLFVEVFRARLDSSSQETAAKLEAVLHGLNALTKEIAKMSKEMDDLAAEVEKCNAGVDSAITLIKGLREQIQNAGTDPAKLAEITESLRGAEQRLAQAVVTPPPGGGGGPTEATGQAQGGTATPQGHAQRQPGVRQP